ncbi:MAG: hypothetical protein K2W95_03670 [Candidatus Obscuribacterales bacterium]|nr:hypothetical protein [Candidatus Obscuribacterales bacterium]
MKTGIGILLAALFAISTSASFAADDNKVVSGAKAVGKGIMWGPKKLASGMKKGFGAMGNGAKKLVGK